nr:hypothetical protein Iba_chr06bCG11860 [Ipomoea batatas]
MTTQATTARLTEEQDLLQRSTKKSKRGRDSTVITPRMATDEVIQETPLSVGLIRDRRYQRRGGNQPSTRQQGPVRHQGETMNNSTRHFETSSRYAMLEGLEENEELVPQELACTPPINQVMNTNLPWIRTNQHTKKTTEQPRSKESATRVSFVQEQARYTQSPNRGGIGVEEAVVGLQNRLHQKWKIQSLEVRIVANRSQVQWFVMSTTNRNPLTWKTLNTNSRRTPRRRKDLHKPS